jgi:hypothetical protein
MVRVRRFTAGDTEPGKTLETSSNEIAAAEVTESRLPTLSDAGDNL